MHDSVSSNGTPSSIPGDRGSAGKLNGVRARSGDESITIGAESVSTSSADLDAHTGDGGVNMRDITVSNVSGKIRRNTVRGQLGAGGRMVRVRTGDGSIPLKRF